MTVIRGHDGVVYADGITLMAARARHHAEEAHPPEPADNADSFRPQAAGASAAYECERGCTISLVPVDRDDSAYAELAAAAIDQAIIDQHRRVDPDDPLLQRFMRAVRAARTEAPENDSPKAMTLMTFGESETLW